jgi:hypothetical protein
MKFDNLLKTIFFDAMPALIRLLGCAPVVEYLNVEFPPRHAMVADVVALLADGRILHVEFQVKNDPDMHWRCYHYFGTISQRWPKAEVIQVVIYLGNDPMSMESSIVRPTCQFRFEILNMQEVPARVFLNSPRNAERVLASVSKSADPRATIRKILASWKALPENELRENVERLRTLSQLRKQEIMTMEEVKLMPFDLDVTESEIYKMGHVQGKVEGTRQVLARLLEKRFGPLSRTFRKRIGEANEAQLELWIDQSAAAQSLRQVFQQPQ